MVMQGFVPCAGRLQIRSPALGGTAVASPLSASVAAAAAAQQKQKHSSDWHSQHDGAESALPNKALHLSADRSNDQDQTNSLAPHSSRSFPATGPTTTSSSKNSLHHFQGSVLLTGKAITSGRFDDAPQSNRDGPRWRAAKSGDAQGLGVVTEDRETQHVSHASDNAKGVLQLVSHCCPASSTSHRPYGGSGSLIKHLVLLSQQLPNELHQLCHPPLSLQLKATCGDGPSCLKGSHHSAVR